MQRTLLALAASLSVAACSATYSISTAPARSSTVERIDAEATAGPAQTKARAFPYDVQHLALDNGLKVIMIPMPSGGLVSYWTIMRTGSRDEVEQGVTGFAHFFEHMMFHGTEKLPGAEYDKIVNGMGADANAFTTDDFTAYHMSVAKDDLPTVVQIEADRFQNLTYDETQFRTESGAVYGEYRKGRTSPFEVLFEAVQNAAFDRHTYKHTTIGFEADIKTMPEHFEYSKTFFQRFYRPENAVIVVAGDFDPKSLTSLIRSNYSSWKRGYQAPKVPAEPEQTAARRIDVPFEGQTLPMLAINFKGERLLPDDRAMVAATLIGDLCFGETSPIYKKLVLDEQRVESLFANFDQNRDPGLWSVMAVVKDANDVSAVERELWSSIDALAKNGVDSARLDAVRSRLKYSFLSGLTTPADVCQSMARFIAITGDVTPIENLYHTLDSVTVADVQAAAKRWLTPAHSTVAVLHSKSQVVPASAPIAAKSEKPVLLPVAQDPNVSFKLWFKVGSQDDPRGKEGLAALVGEMISQGGTQANTYDKILERLFPLAAGYGVSVDKEMTVVSGEVHHDNLETYYQLLADAVVRPGFREDDFQRIKASMISGIENSLRFSSDEELGKATLCSRVWAGTPYAHIDEGTVESLKAITLDDVRSFWKAHYTRDNVVIGLGGSYPSSMPERVAADLALLAPGTPAATPAPKPPAISGRNVTIVKKSGASTAISFGHPIDVHRGSKDYYALWIANSWLGEHRNSSSHLYQVIREARGMNYGDYSYIEAYPNGGRRTKPPTGVGRRQQQFEVWIRPVPEKQTVFALRAALREVDLLAKNGLTREQFEFTRKFLKNYALHFAETTADRLGYAIDDRYFGIDDDLATFRKMMDSLTLEDVNAAVKKYLSADDLQIAIVTEHADELKALLTSDAPSPIDYGAIQKPKPILDADREIERFPLKVSDANVTIVPVEQMFESSDAKP